MRAPGAPGVTRIRWRALSPSGVSQLGSSSMCTIMYASSSGSTLRHDLTSSYAPLCEM